MKKLLTSAAFLLAALLAVRLALMATTPVFDPSEARYAALAANMARTGDFVVPRFTHKGVYQSFDGKPPLVFQAGGVLCRALGTDSPVTLQLGARLFPLACAALLLWILYGSVRRAADPEAARLAVLVCATTTAFYAAAGLAMTDMSLTCCVAGALLWYGDFARTRRLRYALGVAALLGCGMLVKGPVALALFGLPVLADAALNRRWRSVFAWQWLAAAPVFFAIAVPWFVLVEQRNPGSVWYFFYNENFLRFVTHDYGDKYGAGREAFRGVAVVWAFVATLPWALAPLWSAFASWRAFRAADPAARLRDFVRPRLRAGLASFPFVAFVAITLFWCLTSRVLLYYLFPMIPLFAAWLATAGDRAILRRFAPHAAWASALVCVGALVGGMLFSDKMEGAAGAYNPGAKRYSYEFYHGTPPSALPANPEQERK